MHNACIPNITIRDVPPGVHAALVARAKAAGQSLQQYIADLLAREAQRQTTKETSARWRAIAEERIVRGATVEVDVVELIRRAREDRTEHLLEIFRDTSRD